MRKLIIIAIVGAICFYAAGKASKAVQKRANSDFKVVQSYTNLLNELQAK